MHLFGCKFCDPALVGTKACGRKNFDNLLWAIITVFQVTIAETSCYSNGPDSPHRRGVTPLLRVIGSSGGREDSLPPLGYLVHMSLICPSPLGD